MKQLLFGLEHFIYYLLILFLPTQLGKHFWPDFSFVAGLRIDYLAPTIFLTDIFILLLFIVWMFRKLKQKPIKSSNLKFKIKKYSPFIICVSVVSYLLLVIVLSGRILGGLYVLLKFLEMAFVGLYTAKFIVQKINFQKVISLFSIGVVFESVLSVFQFVKQGSIGGVLYFLGEREFTGATPGIANASLNGELVLRPYGTFPHPNVLAGFLVVAMILILYSMQFGNPKKVFSMKYSVLRIIPLLSLILGTTALFFSMSRVAFLVWVSAGVYFLFKKAKKKIIVPLLILWTISLALSPLAARFTNINISEESVVQRRILIDRSSGMLKNSPLFGVGLGNFIPALSGVQSSLTVSTYLQPVHNIFLLVAVEAGLIGLGIFVWFLWKTFQTVKSKASNVKAPFLTALSAMLILGLFDHYWLTLQQGQLLFAVVVGFCWSSIYGLKHR